jgi:hypothetical protein
MRTIRFVLRVEVTESLASDAVEALLSRVAQKVRGNLTARTIEWRGNPPTHGMQVETRQLVKKGAAK